MEVKDVSIIRPSVARRRIRRQLRDVQDLRGTEPQRSAKLLRLRLGVGDTYQVLNSHRGQARMAANRSPSVVIALGRLAN